MKAVYKFNWYGSRGYDVDGLFVAPKSYIEKLLGKDVYFGEICGKHSEVYGTLDEEDLTLVTDDPEIVAIFEENNISSGYNPVEYMLEDVEYKNGIYTLDDGTEIKEIE